MFDLQPKAKLNSSSTAEPQPDEAKIRQDLAYNAGAYSLMVLSQQFESTLILPKQSG